MTLTPQWLDELRARTMLSTLIGRSIKVTRAGREWKACCPFHDEKTPSFTINDDKGFYHCFGCGAHGDAIRWMTDHRGLSFIDGVKELAATAGMDLPAPDPRAAKRAERQLGLRDVVDAAQHWFVDNLSGDAGEPVRQYIQSRGISRATAQKFGMGFAPDSRDALRSVLARFGDAMATEAGMLISVDDKPPYDRFRGRLMIPIRDARGRTIGFGGRILGEGEPKYLNSPDTPLFDKGRTLFNLDLAAAAARKSERLIVVEGYMDVIALAEAGVADAVAPLGTALTEAQLELAWRQVDVPLLAFDGDAAGQRAAMRAAMRALPLLRPGRSLAFIRLPQGQDPDDIVRGGGADAFTRLCDDATPLVDFLWHAALASQRDDTPESRAAVRAELDKWVGEMADRDVAAHYRHGFNERVSAHFFTRAPRDAGAAPARGGRTPYCPAEKPPSAAMRNIAASIDAGLIGAILAGLIRYPALIGEQIDLISRLPVPDGPLKSLHSCLMEVILDVSGLDMDGLLTILRTNNQYNIAARVLDAGRMRFSFTREILDTDAAANARAAAAQDLRDAIATIVAWGEAEEALQRATTHFAERMDEDSFAEQQRAMQARQYLAEQIATMREVAEKSAV
ncbi:MAG: DNA primase [Sphingomonadaceae bacterium]|nr:DNA primase [Sphingomonadaceae bacterium]